MVLVIPWPDPPVLAAIIAALGVGFGAWLTWLASGARDLRVRIDTLEGRIDKVEAEKDRLAADRNELLVLVSAMASFINRVGLWIEAGMDKRRKPKPPVQVVPHIDTEPWMPEPEDVRG